MGSLGEGVGGSDGGSVDNVNEMGAKTEQEEF